MNNKFVSILVFFGAIIMLINIHKYFLFSKKVSNMEEVATRVTGLLLKVYIMLLSFFLVGYIVIGISFVVPLFSIHEILVGFLFFFGSIFVYIGMAIQIKLTNAVEKSNVKMIEVLISTVESRDPNLNGHSRHVAQLTMLLYNHMPKEYRKKINKDKLEYAALLHDIGKLGIAENVLNKNSPLDEEEWMLIKNHTMIGKNILKSIEYLNEISDWVLYHHERWDGEGYYFLQKDAIPIASCMIAVADTYSAITTQRSYRESRSHEDAIGILKECSNFQLNPFMVNVFLGIEKELVINCMPELFNIDYLESIKNTG